MPGHIEWSITRLMGTTMSTTTNTSLAWQLNLKFQNSLATLYNTKPTMIKGTDPSRLSLLNVLSEPYMLHCSSWKLQWTYGKKQHYH